MMVIALKEVCLCGLKSVTGFWPENDPTPPGQSK
jgi:hypothetical protein